MRAYYRTSRRTAVSAHFSLGWLALAVFLWPVWLVIAAFTLLGDETWGFVWRIAAFVLLMYVFWNAF